MELKQTLKSSLEYIFSFFGIGLKLYRERPQKDINLFDKNELSEFFLNGELSQLYKQSLKSTLSGKKPDDDIYKQLRYLSLIQLVKYICSQNLSGDIAECGSFQGHSAHIIATLLKQNNINKQLHIFDSFEGLSRRNEEFDLAKNNLSEEAITEEIGRFKFSLEGLKENLREFNFIKYYKGWIPERFHEIEDKRFCFVHIDLDLYDPILASLNFFYPRLENGGVMVIDDYGYTHFQGAEKAFKEFFSDKNVSFSYMVPSGSAFIIK